MEALAISLATIALVLGLVSNPMESMSPVKVKSCDVAYIESGGSIITSEMEFTNGVTITLMNTTAKPVTSVTVMGSYNHYHVTDTWTGSLKPGAELSVYKHYQQLPYVNSKADCRVTKVTYADGTAWPSP